MSDRDRATELNFAAWGSRLAAAVLPRIGLLQRPLICRVVSRRRVVVRRLSGSRLHHDRRSGRRRLARSRVSRRGVREPTSFRRGLSDCHRRWSRCRRLDDHGTRFVSHGTLSVIHMMTPLMNLRPAIPADMAAGFFRSNHIASQRCAGKHRTNHSRQNQTFVSSHVTPPPDKRFLGPVAARHEQPRSRGTVGRLPEPLASVSPADLQHLGRSTSEWVILRSHAPTNAEREQRS